MIRAHLRRGFSVYSVVMASLCGLLLSSGVLWAIPACPDPITVRQPDGTSVQVAARGDEFYHWYEDAQGYTVVRDGAGRYVYAQVDAATDLLTATDLVVGTADPTSAGLSPKLAPSKATLADLRQSGHMLQTSPLNIPAGVELSPVGSGVGHGMEFAPPPDAPRVVNNLVLLVAFNDHYDPCSLDVLRSHGKDPCHYDILFNWNVPEYDPHPSGIAPTGSVRDYFWHQSYGKLLLNSTVSPWIKLPLDEAYYTENDFRALDMVLHALVRADARPDIDFRDFDNDGDGVIDSLTIVHSGYDGSSGAPGIWSHKWTLAGDWTGDGEEDTYVTSDGIEVADYCTVPALWALGEQQGTDISRIGVIVHELGHLVLKLPDLYDTDGSSEGVGNWGLMGGGSWGFVPDDEPRYDTLQLFPSHMCAWSKQTVGWITPQVIEYPAHNGEDPWGVYDIGLSADDEDAFYRINLVYQHFSVRSEVPSAEFAEIVFDPDLGADVITELEFLTDQQSTGLFWGGTAAGLNLETGAMFATSDVDFAVGPNKSDLISASMGDITTPAGMKFTYFNPEGSQLNMNVIFASEDAGSITDALLIYVDGEAEDNLVTYTVTPATEIDNSRDDDGPEFDLEYNKFFSLATVTLDLAQALMDPEDPEWVYDPAEAHDIMIVLSMPPGGEAISDSALFIQPKSISTNMIEPPLEVAKPSEYLLIENRQPVGYETAIPTSGLAIWHIDGEKPNNNDEGYPGQGSGEEGSIDDPFAVWPENGRHYEVALLQADGWYDLERAYNRGDHTDLYHGAYRTALTSSTLPSTDVYSGGVVYPTNVSITNISETGEQMCFVYRDRPGATTEGTAYGDDYDRAISINECGERYIDGEWLPGDCGWASSDYDCMNDPCGCGPDGCDGDDGGSGGETVCAEAYRYRGSTVGATETYLPSFLSPKRWMLGSVCAGYDFANRPIDTIDNRLPIDPIDVWHTFTPCTSGSVTFNLCSSDFDTTLQIYDDPCDILDGSKDDDQCGHPCNDDGATTEECFYHSKLVTNLEGDHEYYIRVGGYNYEDGNFVLTVYPTDPPLNDELEYAIGLSEGITWSGTTEGATPSEDPCGAVPPHWATDGVLYDVWHQYVVTKDCMLTVEVSYEEQMCSSFDTTITIYDDPFALNAPLHYADDPDALSSVAYLAAQQGDEYWIRVAGAGLTSGEYDILVQESGSNDTCAEAILVVDEVLYGRSYPGTLVGATPTPGYPVTVDPCNPRTDTLDVWYRYTPKVDADVTVSLRGSAIDTTLAIFDTCGGSELAFNDDIGIDDYLYIQQSELTMPMTANMPYYIRVAAFGDQVGEFLLTIKGGEGDGEFALEGPYELRWYQDQPVSDCLTASGGTPPYGNWQVLTTEPRYWSQLGSSLFEPASGIDQGWSGDDTYWTYTLPWTFPYFGQTYTGINVCSNGFMDFVESVDTAAENSETGTTRSLDVNVRIAPLWDDLVIATVYVAEEPGLVTFRWQGEAFANSTPVDFAAVLFSDGRIRFDYGLTNTLLTPTVGISSGNGTDYVVVPGYDQAASLAGAESVIFVPPFDRSGALPEGIMVDTNTGCFSGATPWAGLYNVVVQVNDSVGAVQEHGFVITVVAPSDITGDGVIDLEDFGVLSRRWLDSPCTASEWCDQADMDHSGTVDFVDLSLLMQFWLSGT